MKSTPLVVGALLALLTGCNGGDPATRDDGPTGDATGEPATSITDSGVYEVGVDLVPGVYLASYRGCVGFTTRTRIYDMEHDDEADAFIASAMRVGDVMRIRLREGEFFTSRVCPGWIREEPEGDRAPDPATRAGACQILVGDDELVDQVLAVAAVTSDQREDADLDGMQERLMAVVFSHTPKLWAPAGELVDFLDNPTAFVNDDGEVDQRITGKADTIRSVCTP